MCVFQLPCNLPWHQLQESILRWRVKEIVFQPPEDDFPADLPRCECKALLQSMVAAGAFGGGGPARPFVLTAQDPRVRCMHGLEAHGLSQRCDHGSHAGPHSSWIIPEHMFARFRFHSCLQDPRPALTIEDEGTPSTWTLLARLLSQGWTLRTCSRKDLDRQPAYDTGNPGPRDFWHVGPSISHAYLRALYMGGELASRGIAEVRHGGWRPESNLPCRLPPGVTLLLRAC
jgi:hypothetical protein